MTKIIEKETKTTHIKRHLRSLFILNWREKRNTSKYITLFIHNSTQQHLCVLFFLGQQNTLSSFVSISLNICAKNHIIRFVRGTRARDKKLNNNYKKLFCKHKIVSSIKLSLC